MGDVTPLCEIGFKYGTDKCPQIQHVYTPFYWELFKDRRMTVRKVIEIGIGGVQRRLPQSVIGASLRMWRDFFPNAQIFGADCDTRLLFEDERIKTFLCDETEPEDIVRVIAMTGSDIDLFVDDANHRPVHQAELCKTAMPLLDKGVTYVIEDVGHTASLLEALAEYDCHFPYLPNRDLGSNNANKLLVVRHKP